MAAAYLYDWAGQRYSKTEGGLPSTIYTYGQDGSIIAENDGGTVTDYVYVDGRITAEIQPTATTTANQVDYVLADRLGTPQQLVNNSGSVVWSTTYQPFGTTGTVNATVNQNLRLPGQLADPESGFSYNHFRDYMPNTGRYLETDPIGLNGGVNTYSYTLGNPVKLSDSSGLWGDQITYDGPFYYNPPDMGPGYVGSITFCEGICAGLAVDSAGEAYIYGGVGFKGMSASVVTTPNMNSYCNGLTAQANYGNVTGGVNPPPGLSGAVGAQFPSSGKGGSLTFGYSLNWAYAYFDWLFHQNIDFSDDYAIFTDPSFAQP